MYLEIFCFLVFYHPERVGIVLRLLYIPMLERKLSPCPRLFSIKGEKRSSESILELTVRWGFLTALLGWYESTTTPQQVIDFSFLFFVMNKVGTKSNTMSPSRIIIRLLYCPSIPGNSYYINK